MADWKTYAKAARNTARKQAPGAKDAARRASGQASAYVRAAGKAIDEGHRPDQASTGPTRDGEDSRERSGPVRDAEGAPRATGARSPSSPSGAVTQSRPAVDKERLRRDATAYYAVASRRVAAVNIIPRVMRALRDALLIGLSLLVIWGVLFAAGIPIPFTTVLIIVGLIVVVSFASGLYAQWKRSREVLDATADPRDG
ncbi:hypothetical protein [Brachybacterium vulturis]|uniref:hypothetical protein n=1 Tax=Brachybacterium vulturis TaxID=2017484 RepID=UPI003735A3D2